MSADATRPDTTTAAPMNDLNRGSLRKVTAAAAWGHGLDGYDLGVLSVALPAITDALRPSAVELGLLGASSLMGIFFGGLAVGWLTDRIGRKLAFSLVFLAFLLTSLLQIWTTTFTPLFLVRLGCGLAIGAEYSVGAPMLAEFCPSSRRGGRVSFAQVCWYLGYLIAVVTAYVLLDWAHLPWGWVLASAAAPAAIGLLLRRGIPESPRWLASRGRRDEAHRIVDTYLGRDFYRAEGLAEETAINSPTTWTSLLRGAQRRRTLFGAVMYVCLVIPYFALFTFAPTVLTAFNISDIAFGTITLNAIAALGTVAGALWVDRIGRRKLLIGPFYTSAIALILIAAFGSRSVPLVVACFIVFAFFNSASCVLIPVYPSELFPTSSRSTGTGLLTAISRVGAALGTFLFPAAITGLGLWPIMLIGALICLIGATTSQRLAPETTGLNLSTTTRLAHKTGSPRADTPQ